MSDIVDSFSKSDENRESKNEETYSCVDNGHGRVEERKCTVLRDTSILRNKHKWKSVSCLIVSVSCLIVSVSCLIVSVSCLIVVERVRHIIKSGKNTIGKQYYVTNNPKITAESALEYIRSHWSIENGLH